MDIARDDHIAHEGLAIVEAYEQFVNYLYPILQNAPRKHGAARDMALQALFSQIELFFAAAKSPQPSRLYSADAHLAQMRFWLRFLAYSNRRIITPHQHRAALALLATVGKMLGAWIKSMKGRG